MNCTFCNKIIHRTNRRAEYCNSKCRNDMNQLRWRLKKYIRNMKIKLNIELKVFVNKVFQND